MFNLFRLNLLFSFICLTASAQISVSTDGATQTKQFPSVPLRGYGTLAGTYREFALPGGPASVLEIRCDDANKAQVVQSKYLSDLQVLPGVEPVAAGGDTPPSYQAARGNIIAAVRQDSTVWVLNAATQADLHALFADKLTGGRTGLVTSPEVPVPMYLDRWDKFGFRFYYYPWTAPGKNPGEAPAENYDQATEFDFAAKNDRCGLVPWDSLLRVDSAEYLMNDHYSAQWCLAAARAKKLPTALNVSVDAPAWLLNRYAGETMMKMPGFVGQFDGFMRGNGMGALSWNSQAGNDAMLGTIQKTVREFNGNENMVSWLEPHGELDHGDQDVLIDFGPAADAGFRQFLKGKYQHVAEVSRRWYGDKRLKTWDAVHVPELAYFAGFDEKAIDLTGLWKIGYEKAPDGHTYTAKELPQFHQAMHTEIPSTPAPDEWFSAAFDDSAWPAIYAPSEDELALKCEPAVFRRTVQVDPAKHAASLRWWLYVWDFNIAPPTDKMWAYINGAKVGESPYRHNDPHWTSFEVTAQLHDGANQVSLRLPHGHLAYRVYLSPDEPKSYPGLGEGKNAEWADFNDWRAWSHGDILRRGTEMIRQVDPNRNITYMHPNKYADQIKQVTVDYGGEFHSTGYMSAFWAQDEPMIMRGVDFPASLEPGGPAQDLEGFKKQMGLNFTEGVESIDYFIHIGDVMWHPDIRQYFEDNLRMLKSIGRYHVPKAQAAEFLSERELNLGAFPWNKDPNTIIGSGYWQWNPSAPLTTTYPFDGLTESDFVNGNVSNYKVVIDTNTEIIDDSQIGQIERYVRGGGVFITFVETGRHTSTKKDAWPICRLTGYDVTHIDQMGPDGQVLELQTLKAAPDQSIFPQADWSGTGQRGTGLHLRKRESDCQDLMLWNDGTVAVGMRPLGKGFIVQMGARFRGPHMFDRWEGGAPAPEEAALARIFTQLLDQFHVERLPAHLSDPNSEVNWRYYVSNNGLDDVWVLSNRNKATPLTVSLIFDGGLTPARCIEILNTPQDVPISDEGGAKALANLTLAPLQTRVFITPRTHVEGASADWFTLQRNWWKGTKPVERKLAPLVPKLGLDLDPGWAFHPVAEGEDADKMLAATYDDSAWERRQLDIWTLPDHHDVKHGIFRKTFTVPAGWAHGRVEIWMKSFFSNTFMTKGRVFLDGKPLVDWTPDGVPGNDGSGMLTAGSRHTLAVEITSTHALSGCRGSVWLAYVPAAGDAVDLAGEWDTGDDILSCNTKTTYPGPWAAGVARRAFQLDGKEAGKNAVIDLDVPVAVSGLWINHHFLQHARMTGQTQWRANVTPWLNFNGSNEIVLRDEFGRSSERDAVKSIKLLFFDPSVYP